jgi:hypothetical protein
VPHAATECTAECIVYKLPLPRARRAAHVKITLFYCWLLLVGGWATK